MRLTRCFVLWLLTLSVGQTAEEQSKELCQLIDTINREWSVGVTRDSKSNVISVILPVRYLTDENLRLLATSDTLQSLAFSYNRPLRQPSQSGFVSLQGAAKLRSLQIQCTGQELPEHFLEGIASLRQLESLTLLAATLEAPKSYLLLTNLIQLHRLTISLPVKFSVEDVRTLVDLRQVRDLQIFPRPDQISEADAYPLIAHAGLTNLLVDTGRWKMHFTWQSK